MLRIRGLEAGYEEGGAVLESLDLDIAAGECVALMGRNGMGKTTLLRTIMGHLRVRAGEMNFDGVPLTGRATFEISNLGIGYVPQGREIFGDLTVEENLRLGVVGRPSRVRQVPAQLYERFPILGSRARQRAGTLSGGEQQQLAVARALAGRPRLLLLDEPSEGIQPSIVQSMALILAQVARAEGIALLLVEQSLDLVRLLTQRCAFMENGSIAAHAPVADLHTEHSLVVRHLSV